MNKYIKSKLTLICSVDGYYFCIKTPTDYFTALSPSNFISKDIEEYKKLLGENLDLLPPEFRAGTEYNESEYLDNYSS